MARTKAKARKGEAGKQYREESAAKRLANEGAVKDSSKRDLKRSREGAEESNSGAGETAKNSDEANAPATKKSKTAVVGEDGEDIEIEAESETLLSPAVLDAYPVTFRDMISAFDITAMTIISSSKVQAKVTRVLSKLSQFSFAGPCKPDVVFLRARSKDAAKLITVVEVVKRTLGEKGISWYQYNCLEKRVETKQKDGGVEDKSTEEQEPDAFETMKTPLERALDGRPVLKGSPFMSICLSRVSVQSLKDVYGEQTNAVQ